MGRNLRDMRKILRNELTEWTKGTKEKSNILTHSDTYMKSRKVCLLIRGMEGRGC